MAITDPLVLPADLVLVPVAELSAETRSRLGAAEGDWALTRRRARASSRVVDARAAELLAEFRTPRTVAEAVLRFSRAREADPEATLAEAFPLLERLLRAGFLVEDGEQAAPPREPGEAIAGFGVVELLQGYEDVEVYLVRGREGHAALKLARPGLGGTPGNRTLLREAAVLAHLGTLEREHPPARQDATSSLPSDPPGRRAVAASSPSALIGAGWRGGPGKLRAGARAIAPRLLAAGELDGRRWLALEWCPGVDAATAAAELRRAGDRAGLLALVRAIAGTYAALHARGILHGDVHPPNVRVGPAGEVRLLDFGLARWPSPPEGIAPALAEPGRGGVAFYLEPEYAAALTAGRRPPPATPAGEQHAVAALLYLLCAGAHARDYSLEKSEMLRQIAEEPPLPFAARDVEPWPELEPVLARALAKEPAGRFASMAAFAAALAAVPLPHPLAPSPKGPGPAARTLLARTLDRLAAPGPLLARGLPPPRASVRDGAAGIACGLYRIALAREDPDLLALADLWGTRAERDTGEGAFDGPGLPPERTGRISPYHAAPGPPCVAALIAHARGDLAARRNAIESFLAAARTGVAGPGDGLSPGEAEPATGLGLGREDLVDDLGLGRAGLLAAGALLLDLLPPADPQRGRLQTFGDSVLAGLWAADLPPVPERVPPAVLRTSDQEPSPAGDRAPVLNLGIAHGWAGLLWATLRWCRAASTALPPAFCDRLADLADLAEPRGRGLRWPWYAKGGREARAMPGWCNGSAGFVHLWSLAHRTTGDPLHRILAEGAAWDAWESPDRDPTLCCGLTGRAYALLRLYREGAGPEWLARARDLSERAAEESTRRDLRPHGLYQGDLGPAVLAADLEKPEAAAMPFFEEEGWAG